MYKIAIAAVLVACVFAQGGPPPFLQGASPAAINEFEKIVTAPGKNEAQLDSEVKAFIARQTPAIQFAFASFQSQAAKAQADGEAAHKAALAKFSPEAKAADAKLSAIADNASIAPQDKGKQIDALLQSLAPSVRQEIESAMQG